MIQLILILIERQMKKNQRKKIREKKAKKTIQNQINQKLMKQIIEKIKWYLKVWKPQKQEMMMIQLILILTERQIVKKQREKIREKKAKKIIQNQINQKLMKDIRQKTKNYLKGWKPPKKGMTMIQLIMILIKRQIVKNQRKRSEGRKQKILFRIR